MTKYNEDFWNTKYSDTEYIYGVNPNMFFKEQLDSMKPKSILLPADGEGRNGVYAATRGWEVVAFDSSKAGRKKALALAKKQGSSLEYLISDAEEFEINQKFDALGLIYAHFPAENRKKIHSHLLSFVKPGGIIIFEAFSKEQLKYGSGGPKKLEMLFSKEEINEEFPNVEFQSLREVKILQDEGKHHQGKSRVIQFTGIKR